TERVLQPHLPPRQSFQPYCVQLKQGMTCKSRAFDQQLVTMGYERVNLVETEGQWSRRGDIVDIFPVAAELPVRLEWFGDDLEKIREFDAATQRSLDKIDQVVLTPTDFRHWDIFGENDLINQDDQEKLQFVSLLDYLPDNTLIAIDEPDLCVAHGNQWHSFAEEEWLKLEENIVKKIPKLHRTFAESLGEVSLFTHLYLSELNKVNSVENITYSLNLASRPLPVMPHQYAKVAETIRQEREKRFSTFLISAQPSRTVALLQEHDCPSQFIPNPKDYPAIDKLQIQHTPIALKYHGIAELEGFVLPTFRLVVITDRELYGQHALATPTYIRKRRQATSKQVDPN
ncbi:MAG: transcription-repair coupling factor, partial [Microcoleaceae cyanobacterium]